MNTIAFILSAFVLLLVVLAKLPGLEHLVRPLIDMAFKFIQFLAANSLSWTIWLFKLLFNSHTELVKHLFLPAEALDPTVEMEEKS